MSHSPGLSFTLQPAFGFGGRGGGQGLAHSGRIRRWCREVGFTRVEIMRLAEPFSAAVAYK
jgi:hypothetical protein